MRFIIKPALALAALVSSASPAGAQTTFFGNNQAPAQTTSGTPVVARNLFLAALSNNSTQNFNALSGGSRPTTLTFSGNAGAITASLAGLSDTSGLVRSSAFSGRYATSASNYLDVTTGFSLTFTTAISAIGFYATDALDIPGQLSIDLIRAGGNQTIIIPQPSGSADGSLLFFGVIDSANPFLGIRFTDTGGATDVFGLDDLVVSVPESETWVMMIGGFGLAGAALRRRRVRGRGSFGHSS